MRWWRYALLALIDVEANFLVVLAYQYTTITSIMIIDSFAIPWVMVLSYFFLKCGPACDRSARAHSIASPCRTRYRWWHVVAVALCLVGLVLLIISDIVGGQDDEAADPLYGDLMCLLGAFLYGVANVWQERLVKQRGQLECLAMLGFFGTLIGGIQVAIFERQELVTVDWSWQVGTDESLRHRPRAWRQSLTTRCGSRRQGCSSRVLPFVCFVCTRSCRLFCGGRPPRCSICR